MDGARFDSLTRTLAMSGTRRKMIGGIAASLFSLAGLGRVAARSCSGPGDICREHSTCCEQICGGPDRNGRRRCVCPPGKEPCGTVCKDPKNDYTSDVNNCGGCAIHCPATRNAVPTCANGTCGFACNAGYRACGSGCIADVPGSCCTVADCPGPTVGTCQGAATCNANTCGFSARAVDTICRTATTSCERDAKCNGTTLTCPTNPVASAGTVCRASTGPCDPQEVCNGTSNACPADVKTRDGEQGACEEHYLCKNGECSCIPKTCDDFPNGCGTIDDGCGKSLDCGTDCSRGYQFANQVCLNNVCSCAGGAVECLEGCFCVNPTDSTTDICVFSDTYNPDSTCTSNNDCPQGYYCGSSTHKSGNFCRRTTFNCV